jgi:hypothetical protein
LDFARRGRPTNTRARRTSDPETIRTSDPQIGGACPDFPQRSPHSFSEKLLAGSLPQIASESPMAKRTISNRSVQALRCPGNRDRVFLWNNALAGFGVAAYAPTKENPEGKEVYVAQFQFHAGRGAWRSESTAESRPTTRATARRRSLVLSRTAKTRSTSAGRSAPFGVLESSQMSSYVCTQRRSASLEWLRVCIAVAVAYRSRTRGRTESSMLG